MDYAELHAGVSSRKRKRLSSDEVMIKDGPLSEQPIENEYEHLDEDDDVEEEETDNKKKADYEQMLKAQEPATITQYDDIQITPFNLEEELEEGEFDKAGNFLFKKERTDDEHNDTWAESIDWAAVEKKEQERRLKEQATAASKDAEEKKNHEQSEPVRDRITCFKQMLRIMTPDETVQKTIRRLGNSVPKRRPTKSKSKSGQPMDTDDDQKVIVEARKKLDLMIELAHQRLEDGDTDIYQKSYEDLEEAIN